MDFKILYMDSDLSYLSDIDKDGEKELILAKALQIHVYKKQKIVHAFTPKYKKVKEIEKIPKNQKEERGTNIGDMIANIAGVTSKGREMIVVNRYNGIASLYEFPNKHLWSCYVGGYVRDVTYDDITNDNLMDFVIVSDSDRIVVINEKGKIIKKFKATIFSTATKVFIDDYNLDGKKEIGLFDGLHIQWFDRNGNQLERIDLKLRYRPKIVKTLDVNNDDRDEIIIATSTGQVLLFNSKGELLDEFEMPAPIISLSAFDTNKDNFKEIFVGDSYGNLVIRGDKVTLYEHTNQDELVDDLDGDGKVEILKRESKRVHLKKEGKTLWKAERDSWITSVTLGDVDLDGVPEILIGDFDKKITIYDLREGKIIAEIKTHKPPQTIAVTDVDYDDKNEIVITSDRELIVYKLEEN